MYFSHGVSSAIWKRPHNPILKGDLRSSWLLTTETSVLGSSSKHMGLVDSPSFGCFWRYLDPQNPYPKCQTSTSIWKAGRDLSLFAELFFVRGKNLPGNSAGDLFGMVSSSDPDSKVRRSL